MTMLKKSLLAVIAAVALVPTAALSVGSAEPLVCIDESQEVEQLASTSIIYCAAIRTQYLCEIKGCTWVDDEARCY